MCVLVTGKPARRHLPVDMPSPKFPRALYQLGSISTWNYQLSFSCFLATRLILTLFGFQRSLERNHQLTTALTSFANLREGVYLFKSGIDPYDGGIFAHSPLLLALFSTILPSSKAAAYILWTLFDGLAGWALVQIWRTRQGVHRTSRDSLITLFYLFNPYIFLPSIALSTSTIDNALLLITIMLAAQGQSSSALLSLAALVHISLPSIVYILPIILLLLGEPRSQLASPRPNPVTKKEILPLALEYLFYMAILTTISSLVAGGINWIPQTWGTSLLLPDLTPNTGLWWYFFTEMFDHFRPFFLMVFSVHIIIYVVPFCIKFQYDPLYATFLLTGVLALFKAYPTLADSGVFLSMMTVFPETFPHLRHPMFTTLVFLHATFLLPLFHQLWLVQGTGNANFFYASTLVFACANGAALIDAIWAGLRIAIGPQSESYVVTQQ